MDKKEYYFRKVGETDWSRLIRPTEFMIKAAVAEFQLVRYTNKFGEQYEFKLETEKMTPEEELEFILDKIVKQVEANQGSSAIETIVDLRVHKTNTGSYLGLWDGK